MPCRLPLLICLRSHSSSSYRQQNLINFCSTKAYLFFHKLTCAIDAGTFLFFKGVLSHEFQLITISLQVSLLMICHNVIVPQHSLMSYLLQLTCNCLSFDFIGTSMDESSDDLGTVQIPTSWRGGTVQLFVFGSMIVDRSCAYILDLWTPQYWRLSFWGRKICFSVLSFVNYRPLKL